MLAYIKLFIETIPQPNPIKYFEWLNLNSKDDIIIKLWSHASHFVMTNYFNA